MKTNKDNMYAQSHRETKACEWTMSSGLTWEADDIEPQGL